MLSEVSVGEDEVQDQVLHNSSGIRTSTRLQAKAWQEARVHQGAPEWVQPSLQADVIRVQIPSEEDELDVAEDSEDAPELLPRPECKFGLKGAYAAHIFQPSAEEGASSDKEDASKVSKVCFRYCTFSRFCTNSCWDFCGCFRAGGAGLHEERQGRSGGFGRKVPV